MKTRTAKQKYHHGDLRRAIIDAGEVELAEHGLAGFSLRRVTTRVGVSHTAPAHHFGGLNGLFEALTARGFRRLLKQMRARQELAQKTPYEQLVASGLGYLDFAESNPELFWLIFHPPPGSKPNAEVMEAAEQAFMHLANDVAALHGAEPLAHPGAREEVLACWTRVHGFAELMIAGHVTLPASDRQPERDALFKRVFGTHIGSCDAG